MSQQPSTSGEPSNPTTTQQPSTTTTTTTEERYNTGLATRRTVLGEAHVDRALANSNAFTEPMQEMITEWAWGNVWNRPGLDRKQRSIMNIGMLIALDRQAELGMHVRGAIRNGLSELEVREAVIHATVYCGAPAGMEGMRTVDWTLEEMERNGEIRRTLK
ncbi:AhpD-like protein [Aspergillus filifer]